MYCVPHKIWNAIGVPRLCERCILNDFMNFEMNFEMRYVYLGCVGLGGLCVM
jgi:hypothetical protein